MSRRKGRSAHSRVSGEIVIVVMLILVVGLAGGLWYFVLRPVLATSQRGPAVTEQPGAEARLAPDFRTMDLAGNPVHLSDYRGRPVVLNAWATWCGPCRAEMPHLQQFYQKYKEQGVVVLAVNIGEPRERVAQFIQDGGYTVPVLLDDTTEAIARPYRLTALPTTFFISRQGQIISVRVGAMNLAEMENRLAEVLSLPE